MPDNKRLFPRARVNINVGFEFVKWNEKNLDRCKDAFEASIVDISAKGARLSALPDINKGLLKKLYSGKNKLRLSFSLFPDHHPINTFARLVWNQLPEGEGSDNKRYGFEFIDIPNNAFDEIRTFVDSADVSDK